MASDASIYSLIQAPQFANPMATATQGYQLRGLMDEGTLRELQRTQLQKSMADEEATGAAYREAGGDQTKVRDILYGKGLYKPAQALEKSMLEVREKEGNIKKAATETQGQQMKQSRDMTAAIQDDNGLNLFRDHITKTFGPQAAANVPQSVSDPNFAKWQLGNVQDADKFIAQMTPKFEKVDIGGKIQMVDTNPFTNPAIKGMDFTKTNTPGELLADERARTEGAKGRSVTMRGQDMTDLRQRETLEAGRWTNDLANGVQVNSATGETRPITSGGQPIQKTPKLTEDQGKATGWLVQADNAFKNMMDSTNPELGGKASAARPGFTDVLAAIPSMGATEGIANMMRGPQRQRFMQASESLSEALLRAATGAGVNKDEAAQKIRELTPRIGDSDQLIKQKMDAIPLYIESLKVRAGPGAAQLPGIVERGIAARPTAAANGKVGGILTETDNGYLYQP